LRFVTGLEGGLLSRGHESAQPKAHSKDGLLKIAEAFIERAAALQHCQMLEPIDFPDANQLATERGSNLKRARTSAPQGKSRDNRRS